MNKLKNYSSLLLPILLGVSAFIFVTGGKILWPSNINWLLLNVDTANGLYAWQFFRHTPILQNPLGSNFSYGMGIGGSIIYAEPLFIFAFPFKLISFLLPTPFQYYGLWILLSFILQAIFSWKLLAKITNDVLIKFFGCIFFVLSPPLIWRLHASIPFLGHWLILAAFFLYFSFNYKNYVWLLLLIIGSLVHPYFLFMLLALWVADLLNRWLFKELTLLKVLEYILVNNLILMLVIWQAGYFILQSGYETGGLGYFRINLLSFIDPTDGLGFTSWSHILRNQPKITGEIYEGFVYLGMGIIILILLGLPKLIESKYTKIIFHAKKVICLFSISFLLLLYALSTHVALGQYELFDYSLPKIFDIFRVSARMALPFYYFIYLGTLYCIIKNYKNFTAKVLIIICLILQIIDSSNIYFNFRNLLNYAPVYVSPLKSPIWSEIAKKYKKIIYVFPVFDWNLLPILHYAAFNRLSINIGYFARVDNKKLIKLKDSLVKYFLQGKLDKDAIYIIKDSAMRQMIDNRKISTSYQVSKADNFYILLPNMTHVSSTAEKSDWLDYKLYKFGTNIFFKTNIDNNFTDYLVLKNGWSLPEAKGIWTDGEKANFLINLPKNTNSNLILTIDAMPFLCLKHSMLAVDVTVNHEYVGHLDYKLNNYSNIRKIEIPSNFIKNDNLLEIEFLFKTPISPNEVIVSPDTRKLGLFVSAISFDEKN
ncbi:DUF6311 domain-containing protein [Rickettsiella endosymbiont of Aleochara curtula]|uniref:DUF6311 domain-containing protein n=1 Tax=Rickettsiella endosymbiont of Aleochara curtula TaxID=3077936 RepID=UPI00313B078F